MPSSVVLQHIPRGDNMNFDLVNFQGQTNPRDVITRTWNTKKEKRSSFYAVPYPYYRPSNQGRMMMLEDPRLVLKICLDQGTANHGALGTSEPTCFLAFLRPSNPTLTAVAQAQQVQDQAIEEPRCVCGHGYSGPYAASR